MHTLASAALAGAPRAAAAAAGHAALAATAAPVAARRRRGAASRAPLSSHAGVVTLEVTDLSDASQPHTKPPVVFLHGLLGSGTNFRSIALAPSVRAGRRVLAVDLRNHGKSPHVAGPTTLEAMADDVIAAADAALGGQPYNLVGHSLGGKTAALVALRAPSSLAQLVVMDIAPVPYELGDAQWGAVTRVVRAAAGLDPARFRSRGDIDRALAVDVPDAGMRSFVGQNLVLRPDGSYAWRINLPALLASLPAFASFPPPPPGGPYAPAPGLPAVFIAGERSRYILPDAHGPAVRAFFPQAAFHTVAGAGHWIHADKPAEFTALLAGLLT